MCSANKKRKRRDANEGARVHRNYIPRMAKPEARKSSAVAIRLTGHVTSAQPRMI
jgi:hypothetical protein